MTLADMLGGWEIILILAVILVLLAARHLPPLAAGLFRGIDEFLSATRDVRDKFRKSTQSDNDPHQSTQTDTSSGRRELILWIAQGFDIGRIPVAPGLFGSLIGMLWFAVLLVPESLGWYVAGTVFGLALSIWLCGEAEKFLKETDPSSVVLDEIVAIPVCFFPWVWHEQIHGIAWPTLETFFSARTWVLTLSLFLLFRAFDVLKPWPIRQSQRLPGGWGVTIDDFLAATCVAVISVFMIGRS